MGQNQNNTGNSSKIASIFGKRRIAQSQPVSMIMDNNEPVAPVKKKVPIIPIIIAVVVIAIVFGIAMLIINSTKTAKNEALANAYANCVSIFYDNGNTQDLRAKVENDKKLAEKVNNTKGWYISKISKASKEYRYHDVNAYGEAVLSCLDDLEKAYNDSWQKNEAAKNNIDSFSKLARLYADYMKLNLTEDVYYDFYIAHENGDILESFKNKMNEATDSATKMSYNALVKRFEAEKKYATYINKNKCFTNSVVNRDCVNQFRESQIYGNITAQKNVTVSSVQRELNMLVDSLIGALKMVGDTI